MKHQFQNKTQVWAVFAYQFISQGVHAINIYQSLSAFRSKPANDNDR
jgi:hypothetical protein